MMRPTPRIYLPHTDFQSQTPCPLNEGQAHHLTKVLRLKIGDRVRAFNGTQGEFEGELSLDAKTWTFKPLVQLRAQEHMRPCYLYFCLIKPDALHILLEKATELGVTDLYPLLSERTVARHASLAKMQAYVEQAAVQCERLSVPQVFNPTLLKAIKDVLPSPGTPFFLGDERRRAPHILKLLQGLGPIDKGFAVLIGPEGGFTPQEFSMLESLEEITLCTLSSHILRAETAALTALAIGQSV